MSKYSIEDMHEYLMHWYDNDSWRDVNMALDSGFTMYAAHLIDSAGALDPTFSDNPDIEKAILHELKKYGKRNIEKERKECFEHAVTYVNPNTNEHAFISNGHVDYLMSEQDMREAGYIDADFYYSTNCEDCWQAKLEGYTMCGECSVPYCSGCKAMSMKQCKCGPIAAND